MHNTLSQRTLWHLAPLDFFASLKLFLRANDNVKNAVYERATAVAMATSSTRYKNSSPHFLPVSTT